MVFLGATTLTSATGFLFPSKAFGPPHVVGVISLADIARKFDSNQAGMALKHVAQPTRESLHLPH